MSNSIPPELKSNVTILGKRKRTKEPARVGVAESWITATAGSLGHSQNSLPKNSASFDLKKLSDSLSEISSSSGLDNPAKKPKEVNDTFYGSYDSDGSDEFLEF